MEQRQVQDVERNHLVAGFLRALEYYKGILFITTNRVGTFDEAFMSRIHVQIHYPDFEDEQRDKLWDIFFQKLEDERETTMRIMQSARDYVETEEMRALKWNGREIRNCKYSSPSLIHQSCDKLLKYDQCSLSSCCSACCRSGREGQQGPHLHQEGAHQGHGTNVKGVQRLSHQGS